MNTFQAAFNYQLDSSLNSILGMRLSAISSNQCHVALLDPIELNCYGEFHLIAYDENTGLKTRVMLISKGHESLAGDLYGIEVSGILSGRQADNPSLSTSISKDFGKIVKIVGLGETQDERIVVQESETDFSVFFPANSELPDIIEINKKTLEVIGLGMDSGKWIYIFSEGEGGFRVEIEANVDPENLCSRWDYEAMEKHMRVLATFDLNTSDSD